jgi:hypothetical protein
MSGKILVLSCCVAVSVSSLLAHTAQADSFYIDSMTDWTGNGCEAEDLGEATSLLAQDLRDAGWSGSRYVNQSAWPQDIMESCNAATYGASGMDASYGDAANLVVIDGHGNTGVLGFGYKRDGKCTVALGSSPNPSTQGVARLGELGGARASVAMWLTCCTLKRESLAANANNQWLRQQLGFHGEAMIDADMPDDFYEDNYSESNKDAWLDSMEDAPGWFTGDNSPMVVSYGQTSAEAAGTHNNLSLRGQLQYPRPNGAACKAGPPRFYYTLTYLDHGSEGCD